MYKGTYQDIVNVKQLVTRRERRRQSKGVYESDAAVRVSNS
jgi:hypothetical protein